MKVRLQSPSYVPLNSLNAGDVFEFHRSANISGQFLVVDEIARDAKTTENVIRTRVVSLDNCVLWDLDSYEKFYGHPVRVIHGAFVEDKPK